MGSNVTEWTSGGETGVDFLEMVAGGSDLIGICGLLITAVFYCGFFCCRCFLLFGVVANLGFQV